MDNPNPIVKYYISGISEPFTEKSSLWDMPLLGKDAGGILLHEYFTLAEQFISADNYYILQQGLAFILKEEVKSQNIGQIYIEEIKQIDIYLEKHGAFYHPARVEVGIKIGNSIQIEFPICFVLNTAVSAHGLALINNEYRILKYLSKIDDNFFVPQVFGVKSITYRGIEISFLLGTWFDGYKEFHLTDKSNSDTHSYPDINNIEGSSLIHIWNSNGTVIPIYSPSYFQIYEKASEILTYFYNLETSEAIELWHHAAGDFVVKQTIDGFDVKLITVRDYSSNYVPVSSSDSSDSSEYVEQDNNLSENIAQESILSNNVEQDVYNALLLFFLNLTLRMRIDRIDGIGRRSLVDNAVIPFILRGFFRGIKNKKIPDVIQNYFIENSLVNGFQSYLSQFSHENLYQIYLIMLGDCQTDSPERDFILKHLQEHSEALYCNISEGIFSIS
ncbi:MAG: hypothetical protein HQK63_08205 [Desulfamplus sp.]|nr:hypothetical protein [Desulfamplus sp.]